METPSSNKLKANVVIKIWESSSPLNMECDRDTGRLKICARREPYNTHSLPHTIHLHGIHPFEMDGNGQEFMGDFMVTQTGDSYTYEFIAKPAGTFIYHCHFNTPTHMAQGMYGAFVVESLTEKSVDKEFVHVLADHHDDFTINGKSFPMTEPLEVKLGDSVRVKIVNAGFESPVHVYAQQNKPSTNRERKC